MAVFLSEAWSRRCGNLYGTASNNGDPSCQCGVVYKLTPSGNAWDFQRSSRFCRGNDGASPSSSLTYCCGSLSGTTVVAGRTVAALLFRLDVTGRLPLRHSLQRK